MTNYIEYLGLPTVLGVCIVAVLLVMNLIGEVLEFKGKIVPEWMKVRKYFQRKKEERRTLQELPAIISELRQEQKRLNEIPSILEEVKVLLGDVNVHYSADNITKRDTWMQSVDDGLAQDHAWITKLSSMLDNISSDTLELLIEHKRETIIGFAAKVIDVTAPVTREQYNRVFKVYDEYERIIEKHGMTNGEVDVAIRIIRESYEEHLRKHTFIEDERGY